MLIYYSILIISLFLLENLRLLDVETPKLTGKVLYSVKRQISNSIMQVCKKAILTSLPFAGVRYI